VTIPEFAMSNLPSRLLYRERYVAAVRPEHPLAKRRTISLETSHPRLADWRIV